MKTLGGRLIERYIILAILPYIGLAVSLLTFLLLAQQSGKFMEILGSADPSLSAVTDIALGLIPNIMIFTLPMSVLAGTAIGFSRLGSDSEMIALRAAGVGTWRIVLPVLLLGIAFSLLTFYIGFEVAPRATSLMRDAALKVTLSKLESPIQPRTFNTELPGKVVYVRDGDNARGQWGRVFIHWQDKDQDLRLITARSGRIDISGDQTELVLTDAVVTTLPSKEQIITDKSAQLVTESSAQLRVRLSTGRNAILKRFQEGRAELDELRWGEMINLLRSKTGAENQALLMLFHKKLALCFAPLAFALLGVGLGGRTKRVGRGKAVLLSFGSMLIYYLLLLAGEQLGRSGVLPPQFGVWVATSLAFLVGLASLLVGEREIFPRHYTSRVFSWNAKGSNLSGMRARSSMLLGLLDRSILRAMFLNFMLAYTTLLLIFLIFTLFELLRFVVNTSWVLTALYLLYLVPLATMNLVPSSVLIAALVSYALLARNREVIVWWASGQSLYRLSAPTLLFSFLISVLLGVLQETVLPQANLKQESYRARIRGGSNSAITPMGFQWLAVADARRLYSYTYNREAQSLHNPIVYEFDSEEVHLERLIISNEGMLNGKEGIELNNSTIVELNRPTGRRISEAEHYLLAETTPIESFKPLLNKPIGLGSADLSQYIKALKKVRPDDVVNLRVAFYRRGADLITPLIMAIVGIPFGVFFGRYSAFLALGAALLIGLSLWASASGFQQLGNYNLLPAAIAAWAAPLIFTALGLILFSRART
jgi:lipopolysaccharide export LptBFGC system permease protein LptF